nr:movement protein [Odontoglossum ringspot virus]
MGRLRFVVLLSIFPIKTFSEPCSTMALVLRDSIKISEFINLSASEKLLPSALTAVKSVRISKVDKIVSYENDTLSDIDLLKGVKLVENGYVCLAGLVVTGEWNLPDNCKGGVSICLVDKRMKRANEATLGSYHTSACKKRFTFKIIPNYSVTTADALKGIWQVMTNIRGVEMEKGFCPLSLEFVSICVVYLNNIKLGLREKILNVTEGGPTELTEAVVDEFVEKVPMAARLKSFRSANKKKPSNSSKFVNGKSRLNSRNKLNYENGDSDVGISVVDDIVVGNGVSDIRIDDDCESFDAQSDSY